MKDLSELELEVEDIPILTEINKLETYDELYPDPVKKIEMKDVTKSKSRIFLER